MHVITHQHIGMERYVHQLAIFAHEVQKMEEVAIAVKALLPIVTALYDVQRCPGQEEASSAWHDSPSDI